ncbi:MAG: hypothetical protein JW984_07935 [Deltaproteobacteria bacterium]|uniref:Uncharacterized protein n=1 Tax=Candidatus Zymogenus saltonus TaxID=2844893 RepID=A0A9D8PNE3_9DELT|nr:hypothetical protein [Candidatus Zymogenus saltonus]
MDFAPCWEDNEVEISIIKAFEITKIRRNGCDCGMFDENLVDCYDVTITYKDGSSKSLEKIDFPDIDGYKDNKKWLSIPRNSLTPKVLFEYCDNILKIEFIE